MMKHGNIRSGMQGEDAEGSFLAPTRLGSADEGRFRRDGDFGEGAIGFDDSRLDVPEEVEIHGLEIVDAEFLNSDWSDD